MGAVNLPMNGKPLAQGLDYRQDPHPTNDAASIPAGADRTRIPGTRGANVGVSPSPEKDIEVLSIATKSVPLNPLGARLKSNLHKPGWLDYTKPHVSSDDE